MIVVGLGYRMLAGKDSVADVLVRRYGFVRRGFADALKDEVLDRLPRTLGAYLKHMLHLENTADRRWLLVYGFKPPLVRALLQEYGTDVRRADDLRYWVKKVARWVEDCRPQRLVVPDVRFRNEAEFVRAPGGRYVQVDRPRAEPAALDTHASESELDGVEPDYVVRNDGTLEDLERRVEVMARELFGLGANL